MRRKYSMTCRGRLRVSRDGLAALSLVGCLLASAGGAVAQIPIHGRVVAGDRGIAGATVTLLPVPGRYAAARRELGGRDALAPAAQVRSGGDGAFEIAAPEPGMWRVTVEAPGHVPLETRLLPLLTPVELPDAVLDADAGLEVRTLDHQGRPIAARLVARSKGPAIHAPELLIDELFAGRWLPAERRLASGADGRLRVPRHAGEALLLQATAAGHGTVDAETSAPSAELVLPASETRQLRLVDPRRRALEGVVIATRDALHPLACSDERGLATLPLPAGAEVTLAFLGPGGHRWTRTLDAGRENDRGGEEPLVVELDEPRNLTGAVLDARDLHGLRDAWVWVAGDAGHFVATGTAGAYALAIAGPAPRLILAAAPGYARGMAQSLYGRGVGKDLSIFLAPASSLAGRVVDVDDRPLRGVTVEARLDHENASSAAQGASLAGWRTWTAERGRFELHGLPAGEPYELTFSRPGYSPAHLAVGELPHPRDDLRVVLRRGRRGHGQVVDRYRDPIAGATVELTPAERGRAPSFAEALLPGERRDTTFATDGEGRFEIPDLAPGRVRLEVRAPGFAPRTVPGIEVAGGGGDFDFGTFLLVAGVALEGRVVDSGGQPLEGAEIRFAGADPMELARRHLTGEKGPAATVSDAAGRFRLDGLRPGDAIGLTIDKAGYVGKYLASVKVLDPGPEGAAPAPAATLLEVVLAMPGRLRGRVVDERGGPVAGALLQFQLLEAVDDDGGVGLSSTEWRTPRTDENGAFDLAGLSPGVGRLSVTAGGYQKYERVGLEVPAGGEGQEVEVELRRGAVLEGRVTAPDGTPVADAWVRILDFGSDHRLAGGARTDSAGRYRVEGLAAGTFSAAAHHHRFQQVVQEVEIQRGDNVADFVLEGGVEVAGRIVDGSGNPLDDATVTLSSTPPLPRPPHARTRPDGTFTVAAVPPGRYAIEGRKAGFYQPQGGEPLVVESASIAGLEVRLVAGTRLWGRIRDVEFDDLARLEVHARRPGARFEGRTSHDGGYEILGLPPGAWRVQASVPDAGRTARGEVTIPDGAGEVELDLEFHPGLTLSGEILIRGDGVRAARLFLHRLEDQGFAQTTTGAGGRFRFENLEAGNYRLFVHGLRSEIQHRQEFELDADRELRIELGSSARISGSVRDAFDLERLAGVELYLEALAPDSSGGRGARTDSRGAFVIEGVPEGSWKLTAQRSGYAPADTTLEIAGGAAVDGVELELTATDGLTFEILYAATPGRPPATVRAAIVGASGARITGGRYRTTRDGRVRLSTVPAGSWELLVQAADSAAVRLPIVAPGHLGQVVLESGARIEISAPHPAPAGEGRVVLLAQDGTVHRRLGWNGDVQDGWPLRNGRATIRNLPPGLWTVRVTTLDGEVLTRPVTVTGRGTVEMVLD